MKKTVKSLIIAASVAAIAGIGAVSFAAWSEGGDHDQVVTGATGNIQTLGNLNVAVTNGGTGSASGDESTISLTPLKPVDQTTTATYWAFTLTVPDKTGEATPTYKIAGSLTKGTGTEVGGAILYWSEEVPDITGENLANLDKDHVVGTAAELTGNVVYVYLVASGVDAMDAAISLTFSVE